MSLKRIIKYIIENSKLKEHYVADTPYQAFANELSILINQFILEWNITCPEIVGCLEIVKQDLIYHTRSENE